jgi:hypothetical protein
MEVNDFMCDGPLWAAQGSRLNSDSSKCKDDLDDLISEVFNYLKNVVGVELIGMNVNGHTIFHKLAQRNHPKTIR